MTAIIREKSVAKKEPADFRVHVALYQAIIDHKIPPGTPLQEDSLAHAFKVSRTVVRKALQRLALERLVDMVPNKGASVAKPSAEEARQVFEARRELEQTLVRRVVKNASDMELKLLLKLAKSEHQAHQNGDKSQRLKLSGDFHRQLAVMSGNAVLQSFLAELVSRSSLIIALYESPGAVPCSHTEHLEIANAIVARDSNKAVQYMDNHLRHIEAQIDLESAITAPDFTRLFENDRKKPDELPGKFRTPRN
jgi:DNA-binding GntR family transcriptional regulator